MATIDDVLHAVRGVGVQVGNLQTKFDKLDDRVKTLEEQTKNNCGKLDTLQKSVDRIEKRLDGKKITLKQD